MLKTLSLSPSLAITAGVCQRDLQSFTITNSSAYLLMGETCAF